jgi:hypothetical protein
LSAKVKSRRKEKLDVRAKRASKNWAAECGLSFFQCEWHYCTFSRFYWYLADLSPIQLHN